MTRYIATQYSRQGIRCNSLIVGLVQTGKTEGALPEPLLKIFKENHATGNLGKPKDIAESVRFLSTDDSAWITGQLLPVDGGFFAHLPTTVPVAELMAQMGLK